MHVELDREAIVEAPLNELDLGHQGAGAALCPDEVQVLQTRFWMGY